jgi:hypothetical protein
MNRFIGWVKANTDPYRFERRKRLCEWHVEEYCETPSSDHQLEPVTLSQYGEVWDIVELLNVESFHKATHAVQGLFLDL